MLQCFPALLQSSAPLLSWPAVQDYKVHIKHTDGSFEYVPYFCLPGGLVGDVLVRCKSRRLLGPYFCLPGGLVGDVLHVPLSLECGSGIAMPTDGRRREGGWQHARRSEGGWQRGDLMQPAALAPHRVPHSAPLHPPLSIRPSPANELNDVIAPSCYSCFDYPNATGALGAGLPLAAARWLRSSGQGLLLAAARWLRTVGCRLRGELRAAASCAPGLQPA